MCKMSVFFTDIQLHNCIGKTYKTPYMFYHKGALWLKLLVRTQIKNNIGLYYEIIILLYNK